MAPIGAVRRVFWFSVLSEQVGHSVGVSSVVWCYPALDAGLESNAGSLSISCCSIGFVALLLVTV
jgi:hypothetical protein